jgi:hypothetical protein
MRQRGNGDRRLWHLYQTKLLKALSALALSRLALSGVEGSKGRRVKQKQYFFDNYMVFE